MVAQTDNNTTETLNTLRQITESTDEPQSKLRQVIQVIRQSSQSDAVSCFVLVDKKNLELFAADGHYEEAIHQANIRIGEGLIGEAAQNRRIINLADINIHPHSFNYPELENNFLAFAAIPIIRNKRLLGILVLQKNKAEEYTPAEIDCFETYAMITSDILYSDDMTEYRESLLRRKGELTTDRIKGISLSKGYGIGQAVVHRRRQAANKIFAEDKDAELKRLEKAYIKMNKDLDVKFTNTKLGIGEHIEILDAYRMLAKDKGWYKKIISYVDGGLTAETAIERTFEDMWNRLSATSDQYLRERLHDLRDISDRLQNYLYGDTDSDKSSPKEKNLIIISQTMGPADLMDYDYTKIRGLIIEDGTPTMHVAIVAKALGIPVISKVTGLFDSVKNGQTIALDGEDGYIYINPEQIILARIQAKIAEKAELSAKLAKLKTLPNQSLDKQKVGLYINVGLSFDLDYLETTGCDGVGLYRTEIPFMSSEMMPSVEQQINYYKKTFEKAGNRRVTFRTLDVGSDKLLPYWGKMGEDNPAIGWRSIRITLDRRAILKKQLQAFLRAAEGKELNIMFPMISDIYEYEDAKETLLLEIEKEKHNGLEIPEKVNIGLMIEVPSLLFQLDDLLPKTDFISIGTNDLAQFIFASDRGNPRLSDRYDVLSSSFLRVMKTIIDKANKYHTYCSVCGEMASNPLEAMVLLGLGYRNLSTSGASYGRIKTMLRSTDIQETNDYINNLLNTQQKNLRPQLVAYAHDHGIEIC